MSAPDRQPQEFDAYSNSYDDHVNGALAFSGLDVDFFTKVKAAYIEEILSKAFGSAKVDVLDVGCGIGNYHQLLRPSLNRLCGVDISNESLKTATQRNEQVEYSHFDGTNLPFADETFDAAFAICVYHHVPISSRAALTASVRRVLRPGGIFMIFEHNPRNPLTMKVVNRCEFDRDAVLLKNEEAEGLLSQASFTDVGSRHILTVPSFNKATRVVDQMFGGLKVGAQYYTTGRVSADTTTR
ncbi:class I SAM-dependent methyltransferase [Microvirga sp. 2YAF29]|uniref:class I SAM-dependent methyltransferase n=1 Tax=Microvirga sp. 2YAF29 TaxID=3233031 RepID=UPI003F9EAA7D